MVKTKKQMTAKNWKTMSQRERRDAVCAEAIKLLQNGQLKSDYKTYVDISRLTWYNEVSVNYETAQKLISQVGGCQVCLLGAMFISKLLLSKSNRAKLVTSVTSELVYSGLRQLFTQAELRKIEDVFEDDNVAKTAGSDIHEVSGYRTDRMLMILQNIIDHGKFKPKVKYKIVAA
jgi:hypothetical protein